MTMRRSDEASVLAEAQDPVSDRALPCELCRRRMRYFPVRGNVALRGYGRGYGWRCLACTSGAVIVAARLSGRGIFPIDWLEHWQTIASAIVAQYKDVSCAYARHRLPLFADALERLCMQLQLVGQALADSGDAVALGNVLPLSRRASLVPSDRRSHKGEAGTPTQM